MFKSKTNEIYVDPPADLVSDQEEESEKTPSSESYETSMRRDSDSDFIKTNDLYMPSNTPKFHKVRKGHQSKTHKAQKLEPDYEMPIRENITQTRRTSS